MTTRFCRTLPVLLLLVCTPSMTWATSDHDAKKHKHFLVKQWAERGLVLGHKTVSLGADLTLSTGAIEGFSAQLPIVWGWDYRTDVFARLQFQDSDPTVSLPGIGIRRRLTDGLFEATLQGALEFGLTGPQTAVALTIAGPMRMHFRENLSLDATPSVTFNVQPAFDWFFSLPLHGNFNLTDAVAVFGGPIFTMQEGAAGAGGLGLGGSYTLGTDKRPWLEVGVRANWGFVGKGGVMRGILFVRYFGHLPGKVDNHLKEAF